MKIDSLRFPDELHYDEHHQWARAEDEIVTIGVTDYAQNAAGDVVFVELPRPGHTLKRGDACGSLESGKWVGRLYAPVSGTVMEVNEKLAKDPRTVNRDPYGAGWIAQIKASDLSELDGLMQGETAIAFVEAELERDRLAEAAQGETNGKP